MMQEHRGTPFAELFCWRMWTIGLCVRDLDFDGGSKMGSSIACAILKSMCDPGYPWGPRVPCVDQSDRGGLT